MKIKNYKKITNEVEIPVIGDVTYFIGTNGACKSSILESVFLKVEKKTRASFINTPIYAYFSDDSKLQIDFIESDSYIKDSSKAVYLPSKLKFTHNDPTLTQQPISNYANSYFYQQNVVPRQLEYFLRNIISSEHSSMSAKYGIIAKQITSKVPLLDSFLASHIDPSIENTLVVADEIFTSNSFADGKSTLKELVYLIVSIAEQNKDIISLILVDEVEANLDPTLHKYLPLIFDVICKMYKQLSLFVSTHSPFVLNKLESENFEINHVAYQCSQGEVKILKKENMKRRAARICGVSMFDVLSPSEKAKFVKPPLIILCEGQATEKTGQEDAQFYNNLELDIGIKNIFISCQSSTDVDEKYKSFVELSSNLNDSFSIYKMKDRDSRKKTSRTEGEIILSRRFLECYVYGVESIQSFFSEIDELETQTLETLVNEAVSCYEDNDNGLKAKIKNEWARLFNAKKTNKKDKLPTLEEIAKKISENQAQLVLEIENDIKENLK